MLTDLTFLTTGKEWPPKAERERLDLYKNNRKLFDAEHAEVYKQAFKRIERVISNFQEVVSYPVIINYQKLISLKVADLLMGEEPQITAGDPGSVEQKAIDMIIKKTDLFNKGFESSIDVSRYGDGILMVYKDDEMKMGMIDVSQPPIWFPIVDKENIKKIKMHVLAWIVDGDTDTPMLYVQVHEKGKYERRVYGVEKSINGYTIGALYTSDWVQTKLDDFAIIQIPNVMTSDRIHGMDDYSDIDSIISELLVRIGQISRILDKHASPSVSGPTTALERDPELGEWRLKMGNYFPRDGKDDPPVEYLVWEASLEANFKMIEQLINFLHGISEMGGNILGDRSDDGNSLSGTALRFKMISPLSKVKRIAMRFKPALAKAIALCSQLGGDGIVDLSKVDISINFMDGLPNDPLEESQIIMNRTANAKSMSVQRVLQVYDGMTPDDADAELLQIQEEEAAANPMLGMSTPFNGNNDPNATGGGNNV